MTARNPQVNVRLPEELKQMVHDRAAENGRSVNAEIVEAIERAMLLSSTDTDLISADQARKLAQSARKEAYSVFLDICSDEIRKAYDSGEHLAIAEFHLTDAENTFNDVVPKAKQKLEELGYICEIDMGGLVIRF